MRRAICAVATNQKKGKANMQKMTYKIFTFLSALLLLSQSAFATRYSWYFKPEKDGSQPLVCPEADFVDRYDTIFLGKDDEKKVYLTFDAGYENGNVEKILDILKENDVKGTFFVLPRIVENNTELCKRMKEEGHLVGNHSVHHKNMGMFSDFEEFRQELVPLEEFFFEKTGYEMDNFFRPPEGAFSESTLKFAEDLGYSTVFWSLAYADWDNNRQMSPQKALSLVLSRTHNGCVALFHPTSKTNTEILGDYIKTLKSKGYEFCLIDELKKSDEN